MATRVILDCDTGTDDAVAIMLAALHPRLELVAVTTVNGNVPVHLCTDNSLRVLDHIGRGGIPVYEGAAEPLARGDFPVPRSGPEEGHGEHLDIPPARSARRDGIAAVFLTDRFARAQADGADVTLVATGPLTNVIQVAGRPIRDRLGGMSGFKVAGMLGNLGAGRSACRTPSCPRPAPAVAVRTRAVGSRCR